MALEAPTKPAFLGGLGITELATRVVKLGYRVRCKAGDVAVRGNPTAT